MKKFTRNEYSMRVKKQNSGFTLIELMVTLAVLGVAILVGLPTFDYVIERNRLTSTTNQIIGALNLGRVEATKQGRSINVTVSENNTDNWGVWRDAGGNGTYDPGEEIRIFDPIDSVLTVTSAPDDHTFLATGFASSAGTITVCSDNANINGSQINIALSGRVYSESIVCP